MVTYLPGDLILCHGSSFISRAIRWATRAKGESATYANHVAGFLCSDLVLEALWRVKIHPYEPQVWFPEPHQIWRHTGLTDYEREGVANVARGFEGDVYGVAKILAHLGDGLLGKVIGGNHNIFRRLISVERAPICSYVWAKAYYEAIGYTFGISADAASPDGIHDHIIESPDWIMISEQE